MKITRFNPKALIKSSQNTDIPFVAVLSIRRYLNQSCTDSTNPLVRVCTVLLEGIGRHAIAYDRHEHRELRASLAKLTEMLQSAEGADPLLEIAEAACELLAHYNREAQRVHGAQTVELRCMIEMLSQTLAALAEAGGESVETLQVIQKDLEGARRVDDIRLLRVRLGHSLKTISDEAARQRERNAQMLRFAEEAARLVSGGADNPELDRMTGLPSAVKAENEMTRQLGPDSGTFVAVFVVERIEAINLRYGRPVGDRSLKLFAEMLVSSLKGDEVCRWRGPSFVALINRASTFEVVRAEVARFATETQEKTVEVDGQTIRLWLGCRWTMLKLGEYSVPADVCRQIDSFVAAQ